MPQTAAGSLCSAILALQSRRVSIRKIIEYESVYDPATGAVFVRLPWAARARIVPPDFWVRFATALVPCSDEQWRHLFMAVL